jgi:streptomycin 3"-adenylyltransferase
MISLSLGSQALGLYFDGSIAVGDFDPTRSDIDLVVVTDDPLSYSAATELSELHATFARSSPVWGEEIEVIYVSKGDLNQRAAENCNIHRYVERGTAGLMRVGPLDLGWLVHLRVLSRQGVTIHGPDIRELVERIPDEALQRVAGFGVENWLGPYCVDPTSLQRPGSGAFAVLTACRMMHTFRTGTVVPKMEAAQAMLQLVGVGFANVIHAAMSWRKDDRESGGCSQTAPIGAGKRVPVT